MTARRYVVRLAREVRQEATIAVFADSPADAKAKALNQAAELGGWRDAETTQPWTISAKADEPPQP